MLSGIRSGTKLELAEPVVLAAVDHCEATYNALLEVEKRDLPVERRTRLAAVEQQVHADPKLRKLRAVWAALATYYNLNAGGQLADSTARSK